MKTLNIAELIQALQSIKSQVGNVPIFLSSDSEGNSYATITKDSFAFGQDDIAVIYPNHDHLEYEEIRGK